MSTTEHESSIEVVPDECAIEGRGSTSCSSASSADEDSVSHKVQAYFYTNDFTQCGNEYEIWGKLIANMYACTSLIVCL